MANNDTSTNADELSAVIGEPVRRIAGLFDSLRTAQRQYAEATSEQFSRMERWADPLESDASPLDDETRDLLDELLQEREALRAELETARETAGEQRCGYESEIELLRHQLHDANQQIAKLRGQNAPAGMRDAAGESQVPQAPADSAGTSPAGSAAEDSSAEELTVGLDLETLMAQVRLLQEDMAKRRGKR